MISCKTIRNSQQYPLIDYRRKTNPDIQNLWAEVGFKPIGQSKALMRIESFVDKVSGSQEPAFLFSDAEGYAQSIQVTSLGNDLLNVLPLLGLFDSHHDYSEKPYAFLEACWLIESICRMDMSRLWMSPSATVPCYASDLNWLVEKIRMSTRQEWFRRADSDRRYEAARRARKIQEYVSALLYRYSKLLFVRVDLGYAQFFRRDLTIDRVYGDLQEFLYLKDWHPVFEHRVGYVWVVEEGYRKGPHIHLLLIYSGAHVRQDVTLGDMNCRLWEERITRGYGVSRNCNASKEKYEELGIGMIHRWDRDACERAVYYATYLGKNPHRADEVDPQYLRMKPAGADVFGTGQYGVESRGVGRPPRNPVLWVPEDMRDLRWPSGFGER